MPAFEAREVTKRYGGFLAVDDVHIAVEHGSIRGLIGPNGAGKTTFMNVLSGNAGKAAGKILLGDEDVSDLSIQQRKRRGLTRSFQQVNIFPNLTVRAQLNVANRAGATRNMDDVIEQLDLGRHLDEVACKISYGDQRRLDLALALVGRPRVLLLDEPSAGLTIAESLSLAQILKDLTRKWEVSVLIVEHDMEVVFSICDQLSVLHLGRMLAEGAPQEIRANPQVISAYLGSAA